MRFDEIQKYSYWDLIEYYNLTKEAESLGDKVIPWLNNNSTRSIDQLINDPKFSLVSQIQYFITVIKDERNYGVKITSPDEFKSSLDLPIKVWRGGGGEYDSNYNLNRNWVSFTHDRRRIKTFSYYDGTRASDAYVLPKREKYWIVELETELRNILLYVKYDGEVIISKDLAKFASVVTDKFNNEWKL